MFPGDSLFSILLSLLLYLALFLAMIIRGKTCCNEEQILLGEAEYLPLIGGLAVIAGRSGSASDALCSD